MTNEQIMALIRGAFDKESFEKGLEEVRWLKDAGFIYQPGLTVPRAGTCPMQDDWDSRAVLSGMVAADRTTAFLFGTYADVKRETETLHELVPNLPERLLAPKDQQALQQKLDTKRGRALLAERTMTLWDELLKRAGKSEKSLRFLGAYFYGDQIERFYLASVMILAAAETGDPAVVITGADNTATGTRISWSAADGATTYGIYLRDGSRYTLLAQTAELSYTHAPLENGREYIYSVRAVNRNGEVFAQSADYSNTFYAPPVISSLTAVDNGVKIVWGATEGVEAYRLYRAAGSSG